jgi:predicted transcriptional regulator
LYTAGEPVATQHSTNILFMYKFVSYSQCYKRYVTLEKSHQRQVPFIELSGTTADIFTDDIP